MELNVGSISLLVVVFGLVEFVKKFGVKGSALTITSMVLGVALGVLYQASLEYTIISKYFQWAVFGLAVGLAACGLYDFTNSRLPKQQ